LNCSRTSILYLWSCRPPHLHSSTSPSHRSFPSLPWVSPEPRLISSLQTWSFFYLKRCPSQGTFALLPPRDQHFTTASPKAASFHPSFATPHSPSPLPLSYLADILPRRTPFSSLTCVLYFCTLGLIVIPFLVVDRLLVSCYFLLLYFGSYRYSFPRR
jgi:hypothetical protein